MSINTTNTDSGQNSESTSNVPFQSALDAKARIAALLTEAVTELYGNREDIDVLLKKISVERIVDSLKGDYATSFALGISKLIGITPIECAMTLVESLHTKADSSIVKIEVAGPGFINFFLAPQTIYDIVSAVGIHQDKTNKYGFLTLNVGKKIAYEYTDPNPFKVFHIGHLMANIIGESLSRLGEYTGAEIKRFCYQGDLGRHVALFIYGLRLMDKPFPTAVEGEKMTLVERMYYMGTSYAKGATYFKKQVEAENKEVEAEVQNINKKLYERSDEEINTIYDLGLEWSLQYFETLYDLLGTKFDQYFFESKCVEPARALIADALKKGIFTESEGAIVFEGEKYEDKDAYDGKGEKLHTRVFITKYGLPTYDAKELGLAKLKYDAFQYDKGIIVTANEQDQYFKVNLKAQSLVLPELTGK
ncbi:MAG: arginyl-tRNA synthetase, partial [Candidatus Parcubacteria bacterium]